MTTGFLRYLAMLTPFPSRDGSFAECLELAAQAIQPLDSPAYRAAMAALLFDARTAHADLRWAGKQLDTNEPTLAETDSQTRRSQPGGLRRAADRRDTGDRRGDRSISARMRTLGVASAARCPFAWV